MRGVRRVDEAPSQAWVVRLKAGKLTGIAGNGVVFGDDWLFEGGWAFADTPRSLSLSGVYLGSGAVWDGKRLSLIGPSHSADAIYVLERPGEVFASNSLPFLLASAGVFDFPIDRVGPALLSLKRGLTHYRRRIYSGRQGTIYRFLNAIVDYTADGSFRERQQQTNPSFESFEEYRAYLLSVISQVGRTYGSRGAAVYVSRGYDSVACAALAAQIDRDAVALCIDRSRWGVPDDGSQIAEALGLKPVLLARRERAKIRQSDDYKEWWDAAESISGADVGDVFEFYLGMGVVDECLSAPADLLSGRVVLTGFGGDEIWAPIYAPSTDLVRDTSDGSSLGEFRLRGGFVHIPVPMLGFRSWPRLREIGLSETMRPWRINHRWYDRPVPRRIAEDAGVPRAMFGRIKHAAAMMAVNVSDYAPDLFRRQIARYEEVARHINTPQPLPAPRVKLRRDRGMRGISTSDKPPAQAWLVRLAKGRLRGVAGTGVKLHEDWLFEGGWASIDTPRSLSPGGVYLGSGAVWDGETLSLIAPSHTAEAVYTLERAGTFLASNSLGFLLAAAGIRDFPILEAAKPLASLIRGTAKYARQIYSGPHGTIHRYMNAIVVHDPRYGSDERQQVPDLRFLTFEEYRDYLLSVIRQASANYGGEGISVYLSRGASSAACAALAAQLDPAATAFCLYRAQSGASDDGTAIAEALGLKPLLLNRAEREKSSDGKERIRRVEFSSVFEFSVGLGLADECFMAPAELLGGRTVLTGFHGDRMWGPVAEPRPHLARTDTAGSSLGEFRLRAGFMHVPVPMLAFQAAARVQAISRSEAMSAWRIGGDYDRPVARRIAEEAGVPRHLFGPRDERVATVAASYRRIAPALLKMLVARYRPAASLLDGPVRRMRAGLARRLARKPASRSAPEKSTAPPGGSPPDSATSTRTAL